MNKLFLYFLLPIILFANSVKVDHVFTNSEVDIILTFNNSYVYKNFSKISVSKEFKNRVNLGKFKYSEKSIVENGAVVFDKSPLTIVVPYKTDLKQFTLDLIIYHCNVKGYCYPPERSQISVSSSGNGSNGSISSLDIDSESGIVDFLKSGKNIFLIAIVFFVFGLLLSFTPCTLPLIPILLSILKGKDGSAISRNKTFFITLSYALAISISYALIGLVVSLIGKNIQLYLENSYVIVIFSILVFIFALSSLGLFSYNLVPSGVQGKVNGFINKINGGSVINAFIIGFCSTLIVASCLVAPISAALVYIINSGSLFIGVFSLFFLGLGMGSVIMIIGLFFSKVKIKASGYLEGINKFFGIVLLLFSVYMLNKVVEDRVAIYLYAIVVLYASYIFGIVSVIKRRVGSIIVFIIFIYGLSLLIGAISGSDSLITPLDKLLTSDKNGAVIKDIEFKRVSKLKEVNRLIETSKSNLILDFRADWCIDCKIYSAILHKLHRENRLDGYSVIEVDLTENSSERDKIMKKFGILGPPALFFVKNHKVITKSKIIGSVTVKKVLKKLEELRGE